MGQRGLCLTGTDGDHTGADRDGGTMLVLPEPYKGRIKYLVDRFEQFRILLLFGYVGGPKL